MKPPRNILWLVAILTLLSSAWGRDSVDELESWNKKSEQWVMKTMGAPKSVTFIKTPISDIGIYQGLQNQLDKLHLKNKTAIKHLHWKKGIANYEVFLAESSDHTFFVLDALRWDDGVQF